MADNDELSWAPRDVLQPLGLDAADDVTSSDRGVVVIGELDGLHRGHRGLLRRAAAVAEGLGCPLRGVVLDSASRIEHLAPVERRIEQVLRSGAATCDVLQVPNGELGNEQVVDAVVERFQPAVIVMACPPEFGTVQAGWVSLDSLFRRTGVDVVAVERVVRRGEVVTSDRVRSALGAGDVELVNDLAGEAFTIDGVVVRGAQLGRTIGFPTANVDPPPRRRLPLPGVYAGAVTTEHGQVWDAAINIGTRPSVAGSQQLLIESHLVGFDGDLYGQRLQVGFARRLRDERQFDGLDALTAQLRRDVEATIALRPSSLLDVVR